jgi:hypothetical protein
MQQISQWPIYDVGLDTLRACNLSPVFSRWEFFLHNPTMTSAATAESL